MRHTLFRGLSPKPTWPYLLGSWALVTLIVVFFDSGRHAAVPDSHARAGRHRARALAVRKDLVVVRGHSICYRSAVLDGGNERRESAAVDAADGLQCSCETGWTGEHCSVPHCRGGCEHGRCVRPNQCRCDPGWQGKTCSAPSCPHSCNRNGVCESPGQCRCHQHYYGATCSLFCKNGDVAGGVTAAPVAEEGHTEEGGGTSAAGAEEAANTVQAQAAEAAEGALHCRCREGWGGHGCFQPLCWERGCSRGACTAPFHCECDPGWQGPQCTANTLKTMLPGFRESVTLPDPDLDTPFLHQGIPGEEVRWMDRWLEFLPSQLRPNASALTRASPTLLPGAAITRSASGAGLVHLSSFRGSCAVVAEGLELLQDHQGKQINGHDLVIRFNSAPTDHHSLSAGNKTSIRLLNTRSTYKLAAEARAHGRAAGDPSVLYVIWRPDTLYLLPLLRARLPNVVALRPRLADRLAAMYRALLPALQAAGVLQEQPKAAEDASAAAGGADAHANNATASSAEGRGRSADGKRPAVTDANSCMPGPHSGPQAAGPPDPTLLQGAHRLPSTMVAVALAMQLCGRRTSLYGHGPPSSRVHLQELRPYYPQRSMQLLASEDHDPALAADDIVFSSNIMSALRSKARHGQAVWEPAVELLASRQHRCAGGELFPGSGGSLYQGAMDYAVLELLQATGALSWQTRANRHGAHDEDSTST